MGLPVTSVKMVSSGVLLEQGIVERRRVTVTSVTNRFEGDQRAWVVAMHSGCRVVLGFSSRRNSNKNGIDDDRRFGSAMSELYEP